MRQLAIAATLVFAPAAAAADKPEDTAKAAAVAFLKAVKAKDVDAAVKLTDVPFLYRDGGLATHKDAAALKTWLKDKFGEVKDPDKVPTTTDEILDFAAVKEKIKDEKERELAEEVIGKDGYVAVVTPDDGKKVGIAIRMKDGKAKVVGLVQR